MNEEIDIILARYLSGEATKKERLFLDLWLAESNENEKQFYEICLLYQHVGQIDLMPNFDTEKAFTRFKTHISEKQKNIPFFRRANFLKMAAAIAFLLVSTFTFLYFFQPSKTMKLVANETLVEHKILENTKVTLYPNTEITYYTKKEKGISLIGKATFNVDSKTSAEILVQAGETYIQDMGTIFTVDATQPDKEIMVEVSEGKVWFYTNNNTGVHLKQNESAIYDVITKQFTLIEIVEPSNITPLQEIVFNNTPFVDAIEMIKKLYGIEISVHSKLLIESSLNASFSVNEPVENILDIIAATFGAQLLKKGEEYMITF